GGCDPRHQGRRGARSWARRPRGGAGASRRSARGRPRSRAERGGARAHPAPAARVRAARRTALRGERHALRLREPGGARAPARAARARRVGDQSRLESRRRRHVLGHGVGGDGGNAARRARDGGVAGGGGEGKFRRGGRGGPRGRAAGSGRGGPPRQTLLNVNVPPGRPQGIRLTRLGHRVYSAKAIREVDPRGRPYYWIGMGAPEWAEDEGTDIAAVQAGWATVTPLHLDLTHHGALRSMGSWESSLNALLRRK